MAETPNKDAVSKRNCAQRYSTESSITPGGGDTNPATPNNIAAMKDHIANIF